MSKEERITTVEKIDGDNRKVFLKTVVTGSLSYDQLLEEVDKKESELVVLEQNLDKYRQQVEDKYWENQLEQMEETIVRVKDIISVFSSGLEPYYAELEVKGRELVGKKKVEREYDLITDEEKQREVRTDILNQVREELGLRDIAHKVITVLRDDFGNINVED